MLHSRLAAVALLAAFSFGFAASGALAARGGVLRLRVIDADTQEPVAARMHLKDQRGRPVRPPKAPYWRDHFVFDGEIALELRRGHYTFLLECGPEYKNYRGYFDIDDNADDDELVEMHRYADLSAEGWWAGDLDVRRPPDDMQLLMRAEDLHLAAVTSWRRERTKWFPAKERRAGGVSPLRIQDKPQGLITFDENRCFSILAGEDARAGGSLLFFDLEKPLDLSGASSEYPSSGQLLIAAKDQPGVKIVAENAFWWDLPMWLASGRLDAMIVAGDHLQRRGVTDNEAWGKPRDEVAFPPPQGNGRWSEKIWYHALNCGLRIAPAAGSGTGEVENPLGYNRAYVHCGDEFSWDKWWENLKAGRVFITNGPLLRTRVQGEPPGHVFHGQKGQTLTFQIALSLSTREPIDYLEIIKNGRPLHTVRLDEFREKKGKLPPVNFQESGWFLLRVVTNTPDTYRYATTAPYYVEFDYQPRVSRKSAQFFLDWTLERAKQLHLSKPDQQADVLRYHRAAYEFWKKKFAAANAE